MRLRAIALLGVVVALVGLSACTEDPPPPPPDPGVHHVTVWQADVEHAEGQPDIVDWVGYGSYLYNQGMVPCDVLDEGEGFSTTFTRLDEDTVQVRIELDWYEGDNDGAGYGCGVQDELHTGLLDAGGNELQFSLIPLLSHT